MRQALVLAYKKHYTLFVKVAPPDKAAKIALVNQGHSYRVSPLRSSASILSVLSVRADFAVGFLHRFQ
jgi:hypothetical protein